MVSHQAKNHGMTKMVKAAPLLGLARNKEILHMTGAEVIYIPLSRKSAKHHHVRYVPRNKLDTKAMQCNFEVPQPWVVERSEFWGSEVRYGRWF